MMLKKLSMTAPLAILALTSSVAFAAGEARHSINIVAHVPSNGFYVMPVNPELINRDQRMDHNPATGKMDEVSGFFDMRNNNGSVHASVATAPKLLSGANSIDLKVEVNGKELTTTPQMVVGETESNANYRAALRISAKGATFAPGDYTGVVAMMFDAVMPVGGSR
jgi:hypothetical protein